MTPHDDSTPPPARRRPPLLDARPTPGEAARLQAQFARFGFRRSDAVIGPPAGAVEPVGGTPAVVVPPEAARRVAGDGVVFEGRPGVARLGFDLPASPLGAEVFALWLHGAGDGVRVEALALHGEGRVLAAGEGLDRTGAISVRVAVEGRPRLEAGARLWVTCRFAARAPRRLRVDAAGVDVIRL